MNWSKGKGTGGRSSSPKSTMQYVLHDKDKNTSERVGQIELMNLSTKDLKRVAREMQTTIDATAAMKKRHGIPQTGLKNEKPILHLSLSWHYDDKPDPAHMMATARDAVKLLGLDQHQVAIVQHTDRGHPHVHVVICLVHPETGRTADLHRDNYKLDQWAHRYEASRNTIRSFQRAAKYEVTMEKDSSKDAFNAVKDKAGELKKALDQKREGLASKHKDAANDRGIERERLFKEYKVARVEIHETAQIQIDEIRRPKPKTPALELSPPGTFRPRDWMHLAHAVVQSGMVQRRWPIRHAFKQALSKISPALPHKPDLSRKFGQRVEGKEIMLPMRTDPSSRMFAARHAPNRVQPIQQIKLQRDESKAKLAKDYDAKKAEMKKVHEKQRGKEHSERNHLRSEANRSWADFRKEHGMPVKQNEWQKQRDENKTRCNEAAIGPPEIKAPPKEPRIQATILNKAPEQERANDNAKPPPKEQSRQVETTMTADLWQHGKVGDHTYSAQVLADPSVRGLQMGHIVKLEIRNAQGERVANFDKGWDKRPLVWKAESGIARAISQFYKDHAKELPIVKQREAEQAKVLAGREDVRAANEAARAQFRETFKDAFKEPQKEAVKEPVKEPVKERAEPKQLELPETRQRSEVDISHDTPDPAHMAAQKAQEQAQEPAPELTPHEKAVAELTAAYNQAVERDRGEGIDRGR